MDPHASSEWERLKHLAAGHRLDLRDLFEEDPGRASRFTWSVGDLTVDLSKHLVTEDIVSALLDLAAASSLSERIASMFGGAHINTTEDRAVMHPALRADPGDRFIVDGVDVVPEVLRVLGQMESFADAVRSGEWRGYTGDPIRNVVNIGIGGSDLGPAMAYRALRPYVDSGIEVHFVSNVDPADLASVLAVVEPATTLFIVASKTFTTLETLSNARAARSWLVDGLGDQEAVASHFVAVSTARDEVEAFGIDPSHMFEFWDWVGGRYSVGSAIGLSLMLGIGPPAFREMLAGFRLVDQHFQNTPLDQNVPVLLGLFGIWCRNFLGFPTYAILPYSQDLARFPAYLQQLDMESNGKSVRLDGSSVAVGTGPVIFGEPGTNGQHAFYQLLHQGTDIVPADLIGFYLPSSDPVDQHDLLVGNLLAQAEALAFGRSRAELSHAGMGPDLVPHRTFPGNRPTSLIMGERLTPSSLGQLIALYEHKVFVQGVIWGINSFDQWGVELGKVMASTIIEELRRDDEPDLAHDPSTNAHINRYRRIRTRD